MEEENLNRKLRDIPQGLEVRLQDSGWEYE